MASIQNHNLRNENDFEMQNITFELIFKLTLVLIFFEFLFFHHKLKLNHNIYRYNFHVFLHCRFCTMHICYLQIRVFAKKECRHRNFIF